MQERQRIAVTGGISGRMTDVIDGLAELLAPDAVIARLGTGAGWAEGPVWVPERGSVLWSDILGNRILEWSSVTGATTVHRDEVEFTNGRTLDRDGSIVQCSHGLRRVERDSGGTISVVVDTFEGRRFNSPNDVVIAGDGAIWFTDPVYGITVPGEGHPGEPEYGGCFVFRHDPAKGVTTAVVMDMEQPNGLAFSPDESVLYVADSSAAPATDGSNHHLRAYDVRDGSCTGGRILAVIEPGVPDGLRVDTNGNLWTSAADGVHVLAPDGRELGRIPVPEVVSNVCFGGPDGRTLFVTATTSLYAVETLVTDAAARAF
jgi:gluconolactonase